MLLLIGIVCACYLIGSFPTAYVVVKKWAHKDVTKYGSGNIGTMNVHRTTESKALTGLVLLGDLAKGALAVVLAKAFLLPAWPYAPVLCGAAVVLGHNYSIYMGFRGGRGLATAAGAMLVFNPLIVLIWVLIWIIPFLISKILVVGTLTATILMPVFTYLLGLKKIDVIFALVITVIVLLRHIDKIGKVIRGTEPQKYWKIRDEAKTD